MRGTSPKVLRADAEQSKTSPDTAAPALSTALGAPAPDISHGSHPGTGWEASGGGGVGVGGPEHSAHLPSQEGRKVFSNSSSTESGSHIREHTGSPFSSVRAQGGSAPQGNHSPAWGHPDDPQELASQSDGLAHEVSSVHPVPPAPMPPALYPSPLHPVSLIPMPPAPVPPVPVPPEPCGHCTPCPLHHAPCPIPEPFVPCVPGTCAPSTWAHCTRAPCTHATQH